MEISIHSLLEGATRATGSVAVIDVFRAFTTAAVAPTAEITEVAVFKTFEFGVWFTLPKVLSLLPLLLEVPEACFEYFIRLRSGEWLIRRSLARPSAGLAILILNVKINF